MTSTQRARFVLAPREFAHALVVQHRRRLWTAYGFGLLASFLLSGIRVDSSGAGRAPGAGINGTFVGPFSNFSCCSVVRFVAVPRASLM